MKKMTVLTLLFVLVASFAFSIASNEAMAAGQDCWTQCGDGDVLWECCEVHRGPYIVLVRCRMLSPETPC